MRCLLFIHHNVMQENAEISRGPEGNIQFQLLAVFSFSVEQKLIESSGFSAEWAESLGEMPDKKGLMQVELSLCQKEETTDGGPKKASAATIRNSVGTPPWVRLLSSESVQHLLKVTSREQRT